MKGTLYYPYTSENIVQKKKDTVSLRGVFSQEANAEAEEIISSKNYLLNVSGSTAREVKNEAIQAIYSLTY